MPLQKDDIDKLTWLLAWKISDASINKLVDQANKASYYYELKDSPFNRPTTWKLFALLVFIFCAWIFVFKPLFFADSWNVTDLVNTSISEKVKLGWLPPLSSFQYDVYIKDVQNAPEKKVFELVDSRWNIMARTDVVNGFWSAIFGNLGNNLSLTKDLDIANLTNGELSEDKKDNIKEILSSWLRYDIYTPKFNSFDYGGTDPIINGN